MIIFIPFRLLLPMFWIVLLRRLYRNFSCCSNDGNGNNRDYHYNIDLFNDIDCTSMLVLGSFLDIGIDDDVDVARI